MNNVLNGVVISIGVFILMAIFLGNFQDTIVINEEIQIEASIPDVQSHLTDMNKFSIWFPQADTVYLDSLDAGIWIVESNYRGKLLHNNLRVNSDTTSVSYKMWTAAYNSQTDITLIEKENKTLLSSRTIIRGRSTILSGINRMRYYSSRNRIRAGYLGLKEIVE